MVTWEEGTGAFISSMGLKPTASKINYMLNEMLTLYRYNIFRELSDPDKICSGLSKPPVMVQLIHVFTSVGLWSLF